MSLCDWTRPWWAVGTGVARPCGSLGDSLLPEETLVPFWAVSSPGRAGRRGGKAAARTEARPLGVTGTTHSLKPTPHTRGTTCHRHAAWLLPQGLTGELSPTSPLLDVGHQDALTAQVCPPLGLAAQGSCQEGGPDPRHQCLRPQPRTWLWSSQCPPAQVGDHWGPAPASSRSPALHSTTARRSRSFVSQLL